MGINLDSLTDIVANSIGVILFILLFAVLSSRSTYYNFYVPADMNPDDRSRVYVPIAEESTKVRKNFLCSGGAVIPMDFTGLYSELMEGLPVMTFENFENVLALVNSRRAEKGGLTARISATMNIQDHGDRRSKHYRDLNLVINKTPEFTGDDLNKLTTGSSDYLRELQGMDPGVHWICFYVESDSLEIFRKAREIAWENGFDAGWEPSVVTWPQVFDLKSRPTETRGWSLSPNLNQGR